jgi:hypothetical protein
MQKKQEEKSSLGNAVKKIALGAAIAYACYTLYQNYFRSKEANNVKVQEQEAQDKEIDHLIENFALIYRDQPLNCCVLTAIFKQYQSIVASGGHTKKRDDQDNNLERKIRHAIQSWSIGQKFSLMQQFSSWKEQGMRCLHA